MRSLREFSRWRKAGKVALVATVVGALLGGCAVGGSKPSETVSQATGPASLVVWTDSVRLPLVQAYQAAFPDVKLKIETLDGNPDDLAAKILLANKSGQGWPDVMGTAASAASSLATAPYDFALDMTPMVDKKIVSDFSPGTLDPCTVGSELICLRGDFAPGVLWYNPQLMEKFGYSLPTTWEDFQALGEKLAKEHPGYIMGGASSPWDDLTYYAASKCPGPEFTGDKTVKVNLQDPKCTRVTTMIDDLLNTGAFARTAVVDPQFAKDYGTPGKVLMMMGPIWYGLNVYRNLFKAPAGSLSFAAPPTWSGESQAYTGDIGGRAWVVSKHSKYQQAAVDLATWLTTGPFLATDGSVTLPAYQPMQSSWLERNIADGTFTEVGTPLADVLATAEKGLWTGLTYKQVNSEVYRSTVPAALGKGQSMADTISAWETKLTQTFKAAGWSVEN